MIKDDKPAFEIRNPETGHVYKIWACGQVEGFEGPVVFINRIPSMIAEAEQQVKFDHGLSTPIRLTKRVPADEGWHN